MTDAFLAIVAPIRSFIADFPTLSLFLGIYFTGDTTLIPAIFTSVHGALNGWLVFWLARGSGFRK